VSEDLPTGITRRRLLGGAAAAAGLGAASLALPANVRRAAAAPAPKNGKLRDIEHVVLLMQENRSFDHYFGTLSGVRGFGDKRAMTLPNGRSVFYQPDPANPDGYLLPYHLDAKRTAAQVIKSMSHEWTVQHQAWNGGRMDNWLPAHRASDGANGPTTMGYFTRDDIPFHYALADAFTVCDAYHCSVLGPTHPNRYMWLTGTIDPNGKAGGPALDNNAPSGTYSWTTYPERLLEAGVSWKFYQEVTGVNGTPTGIPPIAHMKQYAEADPSSELYKRALTPTPTGQFEYDAMNDQLPTVSWLFPPTQCDEHPARMPSAGAAYIASKIDAIAANPKVWNKTAFILTYDENDGMFDHVAPPVAPAGTPDEFVPGTSVTGVDGAGLPVGPGYRVPTVIVSPWTVGGYVHSEVPDHTSILRLLERVTGVSEPNISDYRRRTMGDLTSAFRFGDREDAPALPDTQGAYNYAQFAKTALPAPAAPIGSQTFPRQEKGSKHKTV
jgi:phospholipase C